jgi:predicted transcriptional regulator
MNLSKDELLSFGNKIDFAANPVLVKQYNTQKIVAQEDSKGIKVLTKILTKSKSAIVTHIVEQMRKKEFGEIVTRRLLTAYDNILWVGEKYVPPKGRPTKKYRLATDEDNLGVHIFNQEDFDKIVEQD